jgi:hypothetical protein
MKNTKSMSNTYLEVLARSLSMRLTLDELEWLWDELREQAKEKRRQAGEESFGLADYQHAWEPMRRKAEQGATGEARRTWSVLSSENTPSTISSGIRENR